LLEIGDFVIKGTFLFQLLQVLACEVEEVLLIGFVLEVAAGPLSEE
jgi:hypothetical protein